MGSQPVDDGFCLHTRPYEAADLEAVATLFTASIHELGAPHYNAEQREAWAPRPPDRNAWARRLAELKTLLAEDDIGLAGFISWEGDGHIDLLYTAPRAQRRGVATLLLRRVQGVLPGIALFTKASLVAKGFFLHQGFHLVEEQCVVRRGVSLRRFAMRRVVVRHASDPCV